MPDLAAPPRPFLELANLSCLITSASTGVMHNWGGSLACSIASPLLPPPSPDAPRRKIGETLLFTDAKPEAAIIEKKVEGGVNPYLFFSYPLTTGWTLPDHAAALHRFDPAPAFDVRWIGDVPGAAQWQPRKGGMAGLLRFQLTSEWMENLWGVYGSPAPSGRGHWLSCRFLPRRRPCTIRLPDPLHLQVYVPLFEL